jgi:hypothetical protein
MTDPFLVRARRGAEFLDGKLGRGWRRKIRRRDLAMEEGLYGGRGTCGCILAQLGGDYSSMLEEVGLASDARIEALGFDELGVDGDHDDSYDQLTEAWLTVLREKETA